MSGDEDEPSIVIDNGSYKLLAGFGGDKTVTCCIYSLVGKAKDGSDAAYYGNEAYTKRSKLDVKCPMQRGMVTDWDAMEKVTGVAQSSHVSLYEVCAYRFGNTCFMMNCVLNPLKTIQLF